MPELLDDTTVQTSTEVNLSAERAFHLFTAEMGSWWDEEKHILEAPLAEMVVEPFVGGHIIDRGIDGSECRWARVLAYEPPSRFTFSWDISVAWELETDPNLTSEVEIAFEPIAPERTRVVLTHRHLDRHGPGWESMRDAVAGGWSLDGYTRVAGGGPANKLPSLTDAAPDLPVITDEAMDAQIEQAKVYAMVLLYGTEADERPDARKLIREHGRRNMALREAGLLPVVGPFTDDGDPVGIGIFATGVDEARRIMDGDPAVQAGLFTYEVRPLMSFPGSTLS